MLTDILITLLLVSLNGFFVAAEFAIVKVRASQLEMKVQSGNRIAVVAKHIVSKLDSYLAATQLGITLASLGLGWIGEPVVSKIIISVMSFAGVAINPELARQIALPTAFLIITILHIVFGELAPKSIAIQRSQRTVLIIALPLQFFYYIFKPFIWLLNGTANLLLKALGISTVQGQEMHSSEELKFLVKQGQESGEIEQADYDIIKNAFDFSERIAKQIMIPRTQVVAININDFKESMIESLIEENYTRIPCYADTSDNVVGVLYLKDILVGLHKKEPINISSLMRSVMIVPESKRIAQLLKEFQAKHQQIAVVINEYGGTEGIVTMEDILEELVGEIQDEYDNEIPFVEKTGEKSYNVIATASLEDINDSLPHPLTRNEEYETLAGYLILKFGRIPNINEKISFDGYEITILKKNKNSIVLTLLNDLEEEY
ncbi:MAG TPA: hemolysin family protein [Prolixibacteraceae bacterium]|nr:hemolysin family protein [Prolixibacteraceae bacterium]